MVASSRVVRPSTGSVLDTGAIPQHRHLIGGPHHFVEPMGHEGQAQSLVAQGSHQIQDLLRRSGFQGSGRLVEDEESRLDQHRPCDLDEFAFGRAE